MQAFLSLCWITRKQKHACFLSKRRKYLQTYVWGGVLGSPEDSNFVAKLKLVPFDTCAVHCTHMNYALAQYGK